MRYIARVIPIVSSYYLVEKYLITASTAEGQSMDPTIKSGDILFIDRLSHRFRPLRKDQIVIATQPVNPEISICKRIIALEGDNIEYGPGISVPPLHYWLEGDNKLKSYDSRHHGSVPQNLIMGRVFFIISL